MSERCTCETFGRCAACRRLPFITIDLEDSRSVVIEVERIPADLTPISDIIPGLLRRLARRR